VGVGHDEGDRLRLDLLQAASGVDLSRKRGGIVEHDMPQFVDQRLRSGRVVHVRANLHQARVPSGATIGPANGIG